jgi:competence protein ComEA
MMPERVDLNTARVRDVATLPGVNHLLARQIVLDRKLFGPFRSLEDLTRVEGLTPRLLTVLADRAWISEPAYDLSLGRVKFDHEDEPIVFVGPPRALRGAVRLRNDGDGAMLVRALYVENTNLRTARGLPLQRLSLGVLLSPGESKQIPIRVDLDPTMPPGKYTADLVAGESHQAVTFWVTENFATDLSPSKITRSSAPGKSEHHVQVHNGGNVELVIHDVGALVLEDPDVECRTIRETVHHAPPHAKWDELVGTASDQLKKNYTELEPLRVRTKNKPVHVEPGDYAELVLEVHVPHKLPRRRNFVARTLIYDAALVFELLSSLQPVDEI